MKNYYKILGVDKTASTDVVKKHFRIKALLTHPDKTNRETRTDFIEIYEAYTVLSNSKPGKGTIVSMIVFLLHWRGGVNLKLT
ncbi:MAG: J domain-containing protein [Cyclobacteriaceae bacterium]|nr:J domain-containing protein [Cyclobacteriaceae bacterium]